MRRAAIEINWKFDVKMDLFVCSRPGGLKHVLRFDLISVPAGTKHWFDAGETTPFVKAIRIFIDMSGWVPEYTNSGKENEFLAFNIPNRG